MEKTTINFNQEKKFTSKGKLKKSLKKLSIGVMAFLVCCTTFLGAACTPNSAATSGPQGAQSAAGTADGGASSGSCTSPINLNPETDPTLFTTQSGLDIKFGGATVESGSLTGYTYFEMGFYNGNPVKWVIIGYHSSLAYLFSDEVINGGNNLINDTIDNSPAGTTIKNNNIYMAYGVQNNSDLQAGELLAISQVTLGSSGFHGSNNDYEKSNLKIYMTNLYNTTLGFTDEQKAIISPKTLINIHTSNSTTDNAYLFPLATTIASTAQNFCIETYLNSTALKSANNSYWLRSGTYEYSYPYKVCLMGSSGTMNQISAPGSGTTGVRPACVIRF